MKSKKKILKTISILFMMIAVFVISMKISFSNTQSKVLASAKDEIGLITENSEKSQSNIIPKGDIDGIKNILLIGADFREGNSNARSDSMMILTLDTVHNKVKLTSLLRDMLVNIDGHGKSKLNHAFAFGGVDLTVDTIENNFGIKIDNYVIIDFNGFMDVIDSLGGVTVDVQKEDLSDLNKYIFDVTTEGAKEITSAGVQKLNGTQALAYCRIRKTSGGEYRRTERQREVINSIIQEVKNTNVLKYPSLIKTGMEYVQTDLQLSEMLNLAYAGLKLDLSNIQTLQVPFTDISIGGSWKNYGWVFRIDLEVTGKLLQDYIFNDIPVNTTNIDKNTLNYNE